MSNIRFPRHGSMQYWPRKRAKRQIARVRSWANVKDVKPVGFAGYKVGMTQVMFTDNRKNSMTKGQDISWPTTIIECPPLKVAAVSFYKKSGYGSQIVSHVFADNLDKELGRKIKLAKQNKKKIEDVNDFDNLRLLVHTQPKLTTIGKKKPELFELSVGGSKEDKVKYAKEKLGKEITIKEVFSEGQQLDVHAITKGKGYQGPVKRFGIKVRNHKSEKTKRGPGSLGGWSAQGHVMYRVAHAGKMGYHTRVDYNKWLMKIIDDPKEINIKSGFKRYGIIKNNSLLIKGSVSGSVKRMIRLNTATRPNKKIQLEVPVVNITQ